jgi:hypothetical protein
MSSLSNNLSKLLATLPAILLTTFINVFISFTVSASVMMILLDSNIYKPLCLGLAILTAIGTHGWIMFNHKLRAYIEQQGNTDEQ